MTVNELRKEGMDRLAEAGIDNASIDAALLLEHVLSTDISHILAFGDEAVKDDSIEAYLMLVDRRTEHVPLQYLTGHQEFMGFDFAVNENVLIPRQDTESLVEEAMIETMDGMSVLDLCTGSGCIIISLSKYKNDIHAVGTDISPAAVEVARRNAQTNGADVSFSVGDLYDGLHNIDEFGRKFDVIVSNPPYIRTDVIPTLMEEVRDHEPGNALDGGSDGLDFYRRIIEGADEHLIPGGCILLETGFDQAEDVAGMLRDKGYREVEVVKDYSGNDRVVKAHRPHL